MIKVSTQTFWFRQTGHILAHSAYSLTSVSYWNFTTWNTRNQTASQDFKTFLYKPDKENMHIISKKVSFSQHQSNKSPFNTKHEQLIKLTNKPRIRCKITNWNGNFLNNVFTNCINVVLQLSWNWYDWGTFRYCSCISTDIGS